MELYFAYALLASLHISGYAAVYKPEYFFDQLYATKTSYRQAREHMQSYLEHTHDGLKSRPISYGSFYPSVCTPKQLTLLLRHGTRFPSSGDIKRAAKFMEKLQHVELLSDFTELKNWKNDFTKENEKILSESGRKENAEIAASFIKSFPELFEAAAMDRERFEFVASDTQRTKASADGFAQGMAESLSLIKDRVSEQLILRNDLLRFFENCANYKYKVSTIPRPLCTASVGYCPE